MKPAEVAAVRPDKLRGLKRFESLPVSNLARMSWTATMTLEDFAAMAEVANEARVGIDEIEPGEGLNAGFSNTCNLVSGHGS